jgi:hypothetical protein
MPAGLQSDASMQSTNTGDMRFSIKQDLGVLPLQLLQMQGAAVAGEHRMQRD